MAERSIAYMPVDELVAAPRNPKKHAADSLAESLSEHGYTEPVMLDERSGRLVAGHGRVEAVLAAKDRGDSPPPDGVVDRDGRWLVPVVRGWASENDAQAERYLLASNALTIKGGWNDADLADMLQGLESSDTLAGTGFGLDDLNELLASLEPPAPAAFNDPDDAPDVPVEPVSKRGDLWVLGEHHRVLCGDATKPEDVAVLMAGSLADVLFADPPYGIGMDIANDDLAGVSLDEFNERWLTEAWKALADDAAALVFSSSRTFPSVLDAARSVGFEFLRYLTVYKPNDETFPWRGWLLKSEASLLFQRGKAGFLDVHPYAHDTYVQNHTAVTLRDDVHGHPSAKQMPVLIDMLGRLAGETVLEPFLGSGSTLIAAHRLNRRCYGIELEPRWVDVALRRFEEHTGIVPILESTGEPHSFVGQPLSVESA